MEIYKGDIFYIMTLNKDKTEGSEQKADRPAVVVSNNKCNEFSEVIEVVCLTTKEKTPLPTHVEVMCHVPSTALCEQIFSVSKKRVGNYIRTCTDEEMAAIDEALMISLGIEREPQPFTEYEVENEQLKRELEKCVSKLEDRNAQLDGLRNLITEYENKIEEKNISIARMELDIGDQQEMLEALKRSDKVVILPEDAKRESETQLEFERNFHKAQYEALFERVVGKAVQA